MAAIERDNNGLPLGNTPHLIQLAGDRYVEQSMKGLSTATGDDMRGKWRSYNEFRERQKCAWHLAFPDSLLGNESNVDRAIRPIQRVQFFPGFPSSTKEYINLH